jgi:[ribosomal protein S18]-alanine N-acetyltransferase
MEIHILSPETGKGTDSLTKDEAIVNFLYINLDQYGDEKKDIQKCLDYVFTENRGGKIFIATENQQIVGTVIVNNTGMGGYIPEHILVYIAVHQNQRGKGTGKKLMETVIANCDGDIALHVEKDNPAKFLYEKYGFTNPYLEMRLKR